MNGFFSQIFNWLKDEVRHKLDKPQSEPTTDPVETGEAYFCSVRSSGSHNVRASVRPVLTCLELVNLHLSDSNLSQVSFSSELTS